MIFMRFERGSGHVLADSAVCRDGDSMMGVAPPFSFFHCGESVEPGFVVESYEECGIFVSGPREEVGVSVVGSLHSCVRVKIVFIGV